MIRETSLYQSAERDFSWLVKAKELELYDFVFLQISCQCVEKYLKCVLNVLKPNASERLLQEHDTVIIIFKPENHLVLSQVDEWH